MASASNVFVLDFNPFCRSPPSIAAPLGLSGIWASEEVVAFDSADRDIDWAASGDDFVGGRMSCSPISMEPAWSRGADSVGTHGIRFEPDSESEEQQIVAVGVAPVGGEERDLMGSDDLGVSSRRDSLRMGESSRDHLNEDFEWEEIDGRIVEREGFGVTVDGEEGIYDEVGDLDEGVDEEDGTQWEVLLSVDNLGRNPMDPAYIESYYIDEQEGFVYTSDNEEEAYEVLFGQLSEQDGNVKCGPPAAKSVIESLPTFTYTQVDAAKDDAVCAVCKDGILVDERVKRLPCSHLYHEECILPWLGIGSTCPLCRFELPTDDPEYEKLKGRREVPAASAEMPRSRVLS